MPTQHYRYVLLYDGCCLNYKTLTDYGISYIGNDRPFMTYWLYTQYIGMKFANNLSYHFDIDSIIKLLRRLFPDRDNSIDADFYQSLKELNISLGYLVRRYVYTFESEDEKIEFFLKYSEHIKDVILVENIDNVQKIT